MRMWPELGELLLLIEAVRHSNLGVEAKRKARRGRHRPAPSSRVRGESGRTVDARGRAGRAGRQGRCNAQAAWSGAGRRALGAI